ncbi:MAG: amino acid adenylation domain-containing protein [Nitrospirae bacterium]|nr:amino acid adenylation domain-containing protein [Nitrospirota bacterium]
MPLLHHLLTEGSRKHPDRIALIFKDASMTYAQVEATSNQLAAVLLRQGVNKGDRVGIMLGKSIESVITLFGILKTGAVYVPLDPLAPVSRIGAIIQNCGITCLVTSNIHAANMLAEHGPDQPLKKVIITDTAITPGMLKNNDVEITAWVEVLNEKAAQFEGVECSENDPAYILYTSGSTGTPKGVVISHRNALAFVNMAADYFTISASDRLANHAPLHFDLSVFDVFVAIRQGAAIVLIPESFAAFPMALAEYIDKQKITVWNSVSSVLTMLVDRGALDKYSFSSLRIVHFSGDVLPVKYLRKLTDKMKNAVFYNIYGQTEANSSLSYRIGVIPENELWKVPIGRPFPGFEVFALNSGNEIVRNAGEEGELYVKGATVALGHWNDEEKTREKFVQDPRSGTDQATVYKTGDIVRREQDGNYSFVGRTDHMVKSRGYRIELTEIELALRSHPAVRQAAAIAVPDELIGNKIIAYVTTVENERPAVSELLDHCAGILPKYMLPEAIEVRESFPATSTGKVNRKELERFARLNYGSLI